MSDWFQSYVFGEALANDGHADARRVTVYLLAEEIITSEMADNTLEGRGHVAGPRAASLLLEDNDHWRLLGLKGVRIETGRIIESSTDLQSGKCPHCDSSIELGTEAFEVIDKALSAYHEGYGDVVECPSCLTRTKLSLWDFDHGLAVGQAMVKFWNWPDHVAGLDARFEAIAAMKCTKVWGRL